jgi:Putative auto-transporter adhesin, head GIN domain
LPTATKHPGNSGVKNNRTKLGAFHHSGRNFFPSVTKPAHDPYNRVVVGNQFNKNSNMKKIAISALAFLGGLAVMAQENRYNDPQAVVRNLSGFTGIKVSTGIELVLSQGNVEAVAVSAEKVEDRDKIITEVKNGVLRIYFDNGPSGTKWKSGRKLKAYVSAISLRLLHASSGAKVKIEGVLKATNLDVDLSSGALLNGTINADDLGVAQNSGSVVNINGNAQVMEIQVSSGAKYRGYDMVTGKCSVDASSGGNVEITVNKELEAKASSGGNVRYKGAGIVTKLKTSSGGSIKNSA